MVQRPKAYPKPLYVVGIDEVGRGPLAGPVAVGAVCVSVEKKAYIQRKFKGIRDSKKLSPAMREKWARVIREEAKKGNLKFCVCFASNAAIDRKGISRVISSLVSRSLRRLECPPKQTEVLLDGSLKAPLEFINQKTIIKGDDKILEISIASVIAKVTRDALMVRLAKRFPEYGFEMHKGYGTKIHSKAIKLHGLSTLHRQSFCSKYA